LLLSVRCEKKLKSVNIWQSYKQKNGCLTKFARLANTLLKDKESLVETTCNLIWLLTTPPHLKYAATLPCNLSSRACFADITVSQGSVATYARCSGVGFLISI